MNNGAWTYVGPRILTAANETKHHKGKYPLYAGRGPTSSVATGSKVCCTVQYMVHWYTNFAVSETPSQAD